jgi:hypothetical protein
MYMASKRVFPHWVEEKDPYYNFLISQSIMETAMEQCRSPFPSLPMFFCEMYLEKASYSKDPFLPPEKRNHTLKLCTCAW